MFILNKHKKFKLSNFIFDNTHPCLNLHICYFAYLIYGIYILYLNYFFKLLKSGSGTGTGTGSVSEGK